MLHTRFWSRSVKIPADDFSWTLCDELSSLLNKRGGARKATNDELTEVFDHVIGQVDLFDELWRQRTQAERDILQRLATACTPIEADPLARQLVREGYLLKHNDKVDFAVPLFREWIRETQGSIPNPGAPASAP